METKKKGFPAAFWVCACTEIFERLVSSGVEFIEIGFLDERREFDIDRTIMPDTASANKIFAGIDKGNAKSQAMYNLFMKQVNAILEAQDQAVCAGKPRLLSVPLPRHCSLHSPPRGRADSS